MNYKLILSLVLVGLVALFIVQNATVVDIRFMFWTISMSRALMIFFLLAIGVLIGWLLHSQFIHRKKVNN
ncbi:MAG: LapA family protein [Gammaproteobacteria bacterium]|nr:LapA family protein [Gammaproteobacteria bacterium]